MPTKTPTLYQPLYVENFSCLGSDCPDTCCSGWHISVEKANYKKIKALPDSPNMQAIKTAFKLTPNGSSTNFAQLATDESGCVLQTDERLCSIQTQLGASYLPHTCREYPRVKVKISQRVERYLTLSCPEAARLCLTDQRPWSMATIKSDKPPGKQAILSGLLSDSAARLGNYSGSTLLATHALIRHFAMDMVVGVQGALWQRMLLLGFLCQKLDALFQAEAKANVLAQVEYLILQSRLAYADGSFEQMSSALVDTSGLTSLRARFVFSLTQERLNEGGGNNQKFINRVVQAFGGHQAVGDGKHNYHFFDAYETTRPHLLRNYMANLLGTNIFPNFDNTPLTQQWRGAMLKVAMVRSYLMGIAEVKGAAFSDVDCIDTVYSFSKAVEHHRTFLPRVESRLSAAGFSDMAPMAIMLS